MNCSNHGVCNNGTCFCESNQWVGELCDRRPCKDECNNNGVCTEDGKCSCAIGWYINNEL